MAQAAVSDVAGHWPATTGQWLLAGRSEKTMAGGSSTYNTTILDHLYAGERDPNGASLDART